MQENGAPVNPLTGRTAVVTGAGAGLGRTEALALAAAGANVVINDIGPAGDAVVAEITDAGGKAISVLGDIGDWEFAENLVERAVAEFGALDIVVNNAGITRDTMLFNMSERDWDDVIRVHLKGHAALCRAAARRWREQFKASAAPVYGRLINTSSEAFVFSSPGQANYASAKAAITALTVSCARGFGRFGVTANAICPRARTGMTEGIFAEGRKAGDLDILAPERVAGFVTYLASPAAQKINGQVFVVYGDMVALLAPPSVEQKFVSSSGVFDQEEYEQVLGAYFADRDDARMFVARDVAELDDTETNV